MKNNKGYYSWIHSLNRAAIQSQQNGQRMINEQNNLGPITPTSMAQAGGDYSEYLKLLAQKRSEEAAKKSAQRPALAASRRAEKAQRAEAQQPVNMSVEGDVEDPSLEARADAWASGRDMKPTDTDMNGVVDAQDVVADAQDGVMGNQRIPAGLPKAQWTAARNIQGTEELGEIPGLHQRLRDLTLALDMRSKGQHGDLSRYHKQLLRIHDQAARDASMDRERNARADAAAEHADEMLGAGHGPLGLRFESVNQKISRLLNG